MSKWDFGSLDLEDIEIDSGERRLKAGRYHCTVTEASLEKVSTDANGKRLALKFVDKGGNGSISESINVHLPKSTEATAIGKKHLKTLLAHGGHPTPDNPGDIKTIVGLDVGVNIVTAKFTAKSGDLVDGSEVDPWHPYFNPEGAGALGPTAAVPASNDKHPNQKGGTVTDDDFDDIPF